MGIEQLFANAEFVAQVQRLLHAQARRFPALQSHADDLVSSALQDLWLFALRRPEAFARLEPAGGRAFVGAAWDGVARIARTILSRRAIDFYRQHAAQWADRLDAGDDAVNEVRGADPTLARQHLLGQMVRVCMAELARAPTAERQAIGGMIDGAAGPALSDAERQRISRLRRRLAEAIRQRLGESARSLLASELRDD